ncbi:hypothetical protein H4R19_004326 [Coemansia spiralis]|nr:hypothetical protein H4R19_004326 [Coemansia spiralis]
MVPEALEVAATTLALVLFAQGVVVVGRLAAAHRPLSPPEVPCALREESLPTSVAAAHQGAHSVSSSCALSDTQLAIAKAVHPHLHEGTCSQESQAPRAEAAKDWEAPRPGGCGRCKLLCGGHIYQRVVPHCSVWLAAAQMALGAAVALTALVWQLAGGADCRTQALVVLYGIHIGLALLLVGSAVQTHIANDRCIKIFFIMCGGLAAHFAMFGLLLTHGGVLVSAAQPVCVVDFVAGGWLGRLPMYASIAHFAMFFFSLISFINGSVRLCPHSGFPVPRELLCVFLVYRGLGTLFAAALAGVLLSALAVLLAALGHLRPVPCWLVLWAVVARLMAAALWHRTYTDPAAPAHGLWTSPVFRALNSSRQLLHYSSATASAHSVGWPRPSPPPGLAALISAALAPLPSPQQQQPLVLVLDSQRSSADTIPATGHEAAPVSTECYAATVSRHETVVDDSDSPRPSAH